MCDPDWKLECDEELVDMQANQLLFYKKKNYSRIHTKDVTGELKNFTLILRNVERKRKQVIVLSSQNHQ